MANQFAGTITTCVDGAKIRSFAEDGQRYNSIGNLIGSDELYRVLIGKTEDDTIPVEDGGDAGRLILAEVNVFEAAAMSGIRIRKDDPGVVAFEKEHGRLPAANDFISFKATGDTCVPVARNAGAGKYVVPENLNASGGMDGITNDCIIDFTHCEDIVFEVGSGIQEEVEAVYDVADLPW
jgi:hypothetical protein